MTETENTMLEKILLENLQEHRRRRRWGIFFKALTFLFLLLVIILLWPEEPSSTALSKDHIGLVEVRGEIGESMPASADNVMNGLQKAFKDKSTIAVIMRISSPGGSPVQAANIYNEMLYQRQKYPKIKLYIVCSDLCASAAYYVASAGNTI